MLVAIRDRTDTEAERARLVLFSEVLLSERDPAVAAQIDRRLRRLDPSGEEGVAIARSHHALGWYLGKHGKGRRDGPRAISHLEDTLAASPRRETGLGLSRSLLTTYSSCQAVSVFGSTPGSGLSDMVTSGRPSVRTTRCCVRSTSRRVGSSGSPRGADWHSAHPQPVT